MTSELITGIRELSTQAGADARDPENRIENAAMVVADGRIDWIGRAADAPAVDVRTDVGGRAVLPGWVDTHTHLVFAGDRSSEFEARMAGRRYSAGGIAVTVEATRLASEESLVANAGRLTARPHGGMAPVQGRYRARGRPIRRRSRKPRANSVARRTRHAPFTGRWTLWRLHPSEALPSPQSTDCSR